MSHGSIRPLARGLQHSSFLSRSAERLVFAVLSGLPAGSLRVELPDGSSRVFGEGKSGPVARIRIRSESFFLRTLLHGDIGFAESYMDGDWETESIARVLEWFIVNAEHSEFLSGRRRSLGLMNALGWLDRARQALRANTVEGSRRNISEHYDLSNELFETFLDPTMTYSSAIFEGEASLQTAQVEKYERILRRLGVRPGEHLLEIGSGWGALSLIAARKFGARVTTVTISRNQYEYARELIRREGMEDRIELRFQDYRAITGSFDRIVSIEMLEAVGDRNYETYFAKCHELLKPGGALAFQVILCPDARYERLKAGTDFIQKHIFPGGLIPSIGRLNEAIAGTGDLCLRHFEDIGPHYARTLREWHSRFNSSLSRVRALGFDERFIRKWNYYLQYCEAGFNTRYITAAQAVYSRQASGVPTK